MNAANTTVTVGGAQLVGAPDRPRRFDDDARNDAYWARIERIVDSAPPLTDEQRAVIRTAFHQPEARRAAA
ncbi:hypothetical protein [Streptomyces sp. NPDC057253]|uniref:hypothetical protein n=1 Tax=Streptomyces sp. NPDC057253 TaxID=3346069 RepID=UPI0036432190